MIYAVKGQKKWGRWLKLKHFSFVFGCLERRPKWWGDIIISNKWNHVYYLSVAGMEKADEKKIFFKGSETRYWIVLKHELKWFDL